MGICFLLYVYLPPDLMGNNDYQCRIWAFRGLLIIVPPLLLTLSLFTSLTSYHSLRDTIGEETAFVVLEIKLQTWKMSNHLLKWSDPAPSFSPFSLSAIELYNPGGPEEGRISSMKGVFWQ